MFDFVPSPVRNRETTSVWIANRPSGGAATAQYPSRANNVTDCDSAAKFNSERVRVRAELAVVLGKHRMRRK